MKNTVSLWIGVVLSFATLLAGPSLVPPSADEDAVRETIQAYFDGYTAGDTEMLSKAFHPDSHVKFLMRGQYSNWNRDDFFGIFDENWNHEITSEIYDIDITGTAACAKVAVTLVGKVKWTDYISLLKIDGTWQIVHKISHGSRP